VQGSQGGNYGCSKPAPNAELVAAFDAIVGQRIGGLLVGVDILLFRDRRGLIALASRHAVPAVSERRVFALAGGMMSYGTSR